METKLENIPQHVEIVFYHIEKCGGTSIRELLYNYFLQIYKSNEIFESRHLGHVKINFTPSNITTIKDNNNIDFENIKVILSHTHYNHFDTLNPPIKITFIRDPIDRVISHYYFFEYPQNRTHLIDLVDNDFELFCSWCCNLMCFELGLIENNNLDIDKLDKLLHEFTFIGKLEYFEEGLQELNKVLNLYYEKSFDLENMKMNENKEKEIKDLPALKMKLEPFCKMDYILYNSFAKFVCNKPTNLN